LEKCLATSFKLNKATNQYFKAVTLAWEDEPQKVAVKCSGISVEEILTQGVLLSCGLPCPGFSAVTLLEVGWLLVEVLCSSLTPRVPRNV